MGGGGATPVFLPRTLAAHAIPVDISWFSDQSTHGGEFLGFDPRRAQVSE